MYFANERAQNRGAAPPSHLCEAITLCQSILSRYKRSGKEYTKSEINALNTLRHMIPEIQVDGTPVAAPLSPKNNFRDSGGAPRLYAGSIGDEAVSLLERCNCLTDSPKDLLTNINDAIAKCFDLPTARTYIALEEDQLLYDPLAGIAFVMDDSSEIGKSTAMMTPYTSITSLYIPLRIGKKFLGCIEIAGGSPTQTTEEKTSLTLRCAALILSDASSKRILSLDAEKAEAMLSMATRLARDTLDETVLVQSIMNTAKLLTESDRCSMFLVKENNLLEAHFEDGNVVTMSAATGIAGYVARTGNVVNIANAYEDERFNREVDRATGYHTKTILCLPVVYDGTIVAVAQLINKLDLITDSGLRLPRHFGKRDEEVFRTFSMFVAASLRNCRLNDNLLNEKKKSDAVLDVVTHLADTDIRDMDSIVRHVLHGAKRLLNADRSSLFLLDKERNELYSRMADSANEIRFPSGEGIAGTVAQCGVGENIPDAYKDNRFNSAVDKKLGYRTQSILCEPIVLNGEVLAVVQLVNKLDEEGTVTRFTQQDSETFHIFSLFAGISINNCHLLEFAVDAGRAAMELNMLREGVVVKKPSTRTKLNRVTAEERSLVVAEKIATEFDVTSRNFSLFDARGRSSKAMDRAADVAFEVIWSTGLPAKFGCTEETLLNFIVLCRRNYRLVPYHNFFHVVDVCQTLHTFLFEGKAKEYLTELECYVLLVTALVHDLDHMGVNNSFYLKTDTPLGILSSASGNMSVLEVHHCNLAIEILSDPSADVFAGLEPDDSKAAYSAMIDCVLATDMAKHATALKEFIELCKGGYNKEDENHRRRVMEILLKCADVSNVTKPFETSKLWALAVTEEFYRQGDMEKEKGLDVLPMFDRSKNAELAKGQIGFIDFVAGAFFREVVAAHFSGMQWCVDNIETNRAKWAESLENK